MATIFSPDSKASLVLRRIADGCYLNVLWFVCSLPVFTIGAATTAMYDVTLRIAENREGDVTQQFFRAFRRNFRQATVIWLILLALGIFLGADIYILVHLRANASRGVAIFWTIILALVIVACIAYLVEFMFVFPLIAYVENNNRAMMVNALLIGTHYLNCTLCVFAIHFVMAVIAIRFFTPILILGEGLCAVLSSFLFMPVFRICTTKPEDRKPKETQRHDDESVDLS